MAHGAGNRRNRRDATVSGRVWLEYAFANHHPDVSEAQECVRGGRWWRYAGHALRARWRAHHRALHSHGAARAGQYLAADRADATANDPLFVVRFNIKSGGRRLERTRDHRVFKVVKAL